MTGDERAIRDVIARWMSASSAGDTAAVLDLMTDDVVFLVSGQKPFGKEQFAAASEAMKDLRIAGSSDIEEIEVVGDWAYLRSFLTVTVALPTGASRIRTGYTLSILRKGTDGRWRLHRDANLLSDAPTA